jgi:hypothetical protein
MIAQEPNPSTVSILLLQTCLGFSQVPDPSKPSTVSTVSIRFRTHLHQQLSHGMIATKATFGRNQRRNAHRTPSVLQGSGSSSET